MNRGRRGIVAAAIAVSLLAASGSLPRARADEDAARRRKPEAVYVDVRIAQALGSATSATGQTFDGAVTHDVSLRDAVVYASGAR